MIREGLKTGRNFSIKEIDGRVCRIELFVPARIVALIPRRFEVIPTIPSGNVTKKFLPLPGGGAEQKISVTPLAEPWADDQEWLVESPSLPNGFRITSAQLQKFEAFNRACQRHNLIIPNLDKKGWESFAPELVEAGRNFITSPKVVLQEKPEMCLFPSEGEKRFSKHPKGQTYIFQVDCKLDSLSSFLERYESEYDGLFELFWMKSDLECVDFVNVVFRESA